MKIAYYLHWNDVPESGVIKKIIHQITQWIAYKYEVKIFLLTNNEKWNSAIINIPLRLKVYYSFFSRIKHSYDLASEIIEWNPDLIYTRYDLYYPVFELLKKKPIIMEINTDDLTEYSLGNNLRGFYNKITRKCYLKTARGLIFVTNEIGGRPHFDINIPSKVISNGINLDLYSVLPAPNNQVPHLVFIGTEGAMWHGTDKIEILAKLFPQWTFHIIGNSSQKELIKKENVTYYPFLSKQEYQHIMANADIAIGSLALHRKDMEQACPLKVREYLAYGLPVIIGYEDMDLVDSEGVLQIANTPNNVIEYKEQIEIFVQGWKGKRIDPNNFKIDVRDKENERINFFKEITGDKVKSKSLL